MDASPAPGGEDELRRFLLVGGFPELLNLDPGPDMESELLRSQRVLQQDAVEKAVYKDIPQAFGLDEPMKLERLLYILAGQVTGIVSPHALSADVGLTAPTLDRYVHFLQSSFIIFTLPNYSASEETVQRRGRKLYFVDGAVRNASLQRGLAPLTDPVEMGLLYENVAAAHLHALSLQSNIRLYHWRQKNVEVDFVFDDPQSPLAFEIASSSSHHQGGLHSIQERFPRLKNHCYLVYPNAQPIRPQVTGSGVGVLPLELLLLCVGSQAAWALNRRLGDQ